MITSVSNSTPATDQTQSAVAQSPKVYETPFGDVLASQVTGIINLDAWVTGGNSSVATAAHAAGKDEAALSTTSATAANPAGKEEAALGTTSATAHPAGKEQAALGTTGRVRPHVTPSASTSTTSSSSGSSSTATTSLSDVPTVESVFGSNPWLSNPTGSGDGVSWSYNPIYFATQQTAETVAQMLGGTVVAEDAITNPGSPLGQSQPNEMVQLSNGAQVNAGLVADLFNHGYSQGYINQELTGIEQQKVSTS